MKNLKPYKDLNKTGLLTKFNFKGCYYFDPDKYCLFVDERVNRVSEFRIYSHKDKWDVSVTEDGDIYRQNFKGKKTCPFDDMAKIIKEWLLKVPIMADGRESQYFSTNRDYLRI